MGETQTRHSWRASSQPPTATYARRSRYGRFRADLFHRPRYSPSAFRRPGNGRRQVLLLDHFRRFYAEQTGFPPFSLDAQARDRWLRYAFPGNVRELRNIVIRLTAKFEGKSVGILELEGELDEGEEARLHLPSRPKTWMPPSARRPSTCGEKGQIDLDAAPALWEKGYIEAALRLANGNVSQAARRLGINRTTFYNRMAGGESAPT